MHDARAPGRLRNTVLPHYAGAARPGAAPAIAVQRPWPCVHRSVAVRAEVGKYSNIVQVDAEALEAEILNRDRPLIIDFYATWCGPCVLLAKELEQVAEKMGEAVRILKIDTDDNPDISTQLQIHGLPTLIFVGMDASKPALRTEGLLPAQVIQEIVERDLNAGGEEANVVAWGLQDPLPGVHDAAGDVSAEVSNAHSRSLQQASEYTLAWATVVPDGLLRGVAVAPASKGGHIYVIDSDATTNCSIRKFDPNGTVVLSFGSCGEEVDQFTDPSGLAVDAAAGVVWVSDRLKSAASLFKFSATTGEQLGRYFPQNVLLDPPFSRVEAIAVGHGALYLLDGSLHRVTRVDPSDLSYQLHWGGEANNAQPGSGPGQMDSPTQMVVAPSGNVLVLDAGNTRMQAFTKDGAFVAAWNGAGTAGALINPRAVGAAGRWAYVLEGNSTSRGIKRFDAASGEFELALIKPCTSTDPATPAGCIRNPYGLAVDAAGSIFVADTGTRRLVKFTTATPINAPRPPRPPPPKCAPPAAAPTAAAAQAAAEAAAAAASQKAAAATKAAAAAAQAQGVQGVEPALQQRGKVLRAAAVPQRTPSEMRAAVTQQLTKRRDFSGRRGGHLLGARTAADRRQLALFALPSYKLARKSDEEIEAAAAAGTAESSGGRFPFKDEYEIAKDLKLSAAQVFAALTPLMTQDRIERIDEVCAQRTFNVLPVVEHLYDMGNLAAVCRSADALGFGAVHVVRNVEDQRYKQSKRSSAGADKWLDVQVFDSTEECLLRAKKLGFQVVVTHLSADAVGISEIDWTRPTAFVLGNEERGVSSRAVELADKCVRVPMVGFVESLNISVAAALIMYEARRCREQRLGQHGDLTERERELLRAVFFLRNKGQTREIIQTMLERPPPQWQKHRNGGDWGDKEFSVDSSGSDDDGGSGDGVGRALPALRQRLQTTACHYWDGCACWGERLLWPGKPCRYGYAHNQGVSTFNKEKMKQSCERKGLSFPDLSSPPPLPAAVTAVPAAAEAAEAAAAAEDAALDEAEAQRLQEVHEALLASAGVGGVGGSGGALGCASRYPRSSAMSGRAIAQKWAEGWPKIAQVQKAAQTNPGFVHRKFGDALTSKYIPLAMTGVATFFLVPGLARMYLGFGKIE
ncbi:RNA methylase CR004 [Micractinium conductrix]|uniref:RNA methylase CR004 n=1 Tax=Micractinium conductrix TaxID=554055 RepID=A0A2P6VG15_9CHLO|nr:RNA methylase CR004 [Micractinium conductrix]|eukprot:PSC73042.1 RNA methylase CR004 [Micractinium conductrix]